MFEFIALLAVATLFGGMAIYSFGFAPLVFNSLPVDDAGRFIRTMFPWYYLFIIASSTIGGAVLFLSNTLSAWLMLAVTAIAVYARQIFNAADKQCTRPANAGEFRGQKALLSTSWLIGHLKFRAALIDRLCAQSLPLSHPR